MGVALPDLACPFSNLIHLRTSSDKARSGMAQSHRRDGTGQARNRCRVASQGLPVLLTLAITSSRTAQDQCRNSRFDPHHEQRQPLWGAPRIHGESLKPRRTQCADFLALRSPVCFASRLMGPILPVRLSASIAEPGSRGTAARFRTTTAYSTASSRSPFGSEPAPYGAAERTGSRAG
jgi:hypothetical protein